MTLYRDMAGYTKLFGSILDSSVWREPPLTRLVWVTLMAMADRDGLVEASIDGIADRARVDLGAAEEALACFMDVDPKSKNPDNDGRRLERTPEGYRLLNYDFYRQKMSADEMRAKNADRQRRHRERHAVTLSVTQSNAPSRPVTPVAQSNGSEASPSAPQKQKAKAVREKAPAAPPTFGPQQAVAIFCEEYKAVHGRVYQVGGGDVGQATLMLKTAKTMTPDDWRAAANRYVRCAKPFYSGSLWPLRSLATNLNEFASDVTAGVGVPEKVQQSRSAVRSWLEERKAGAK